MPRLRVSLLLADARRGRGLSRLIDTAPNDVPQGLDGLRHRNGVGSTLRVEVGEVMNHHHQTPTQLALAGAHLVDAALLRRRVERLLERFLLGRGPLRIRLNLGRHARAVAVFARVGLLRRGELRALDARVVPLRPLRHLRARRLGRGALDERLELVVGQSWCFSGQHRQRRSSARGAGRVRGRRRLRGSHQHRRGGTLDSNPELWTVRLAGRPAAVRGPSRSSRLEQKARGRFSAGGLQWRPRARHLAGSRALLTIASYRMRPRAPQLSADS